mmetsp:Transcript_13946/g.39690  ORF Transcript_13946/g.39690 Transcript_13946/m.39690 type:complete len:467 (-) Transcript_13946:1374-2774(-)
MRRYRLGDAAAIIVEEAGRARIAAAEAVVPLATRAWGGLGSAVVIGGTRRRCRRLAPNRLLVHHRIGRRALANWVRRVVGEHGRIVLAVIIAQILAAGAEVVVLHHARLGFVGAAVRGVAAQLREDALGIAQQLEEADSRFVSPVGQPRGFGGIHRDRGRVVDGASVHRHGVGVLVAELVGLLLVRRRGAGVAGALPHLGNLVHADVGLLVEHRFDRHLCDDAVVALEPFAVLLHEGDVMARCAGLSLMHQNPDELVGRRARLVEVGHVVLNVQTQRELDALVQPDQPTEAIERKSFQVTYEYRRGGGQSQALGDGLLAVASRTEHGVVLLQDLVLGELGQRMRQRGDVHLVDVEREVHVPVSRERRASAAPAGHRRFQQPVEQAGQLLVASVHHQRAQQRTQELVRILLLVWHEAFGQAVGMPRDVLRVDDVLLFHRSLGGVGRHVPPRRTLIAALATLLLLLLP